MRNLARIFITAAIVMSSLGSTAFADTATDMGAVLNQMRADNGRKAVKASPQLMRAAQAHADDMLKKNYFSHQSKSGATHTDRIKRAGFRGCLYLENIASGQKTVSDVMMTWRKSPPHHKNHMSRKATHYGAAQAGPYWVIVMAQERVKKCR